MKFLKMQGCGNDYVYCDTLTDTVADPSGLAVRVSDRHFGIGSDGLIVIGRSDSADFSMNIYNADGSRAEMCGNGIRCAAKYVYDRCLTQKTELDFETLAGLRHVSLISDGAGRITGAEVCMGRADVSGGNTHLTLSGGEVSLVRVSMGNPHAVIFAEEPDMVSVNDIGREIEEHPMFSEGTNVEFVKIESRQRIVMRVWERGSGETLACGTGACAAFAAAYSRRLTDETVTVRLPGGELGVRLDTETGLIYMSGPAATVFSGEWPE